MAQFTVDTHLFRELGELLVGRDSTALVELIKNAYDADATRVTVLGDRLDDPDAGRIVITDDGVGMNEQQFKDGFLCIASRIKSGIQGTLAGYRRRYTGEKGIGRLAAHKLARLVQVESVPSGSVSGDRRTVIGSIDWDRVEALRTLDEIESSNAVDLNIGPAVAGPGNGTTIVLSRLRRRWDENERGSFLREVTSFQPPHVLLSPPTGVEEADLLFQEPKVRNSASDDPGCKVDLTGDFASGDDYWRDLAAEAWWVLEIAATCRGVHYNILPTEHPRRREKYPDAERQRYRLEHPSPLAGPFFQARILLREGALSRTLVQVQATRAPGIRAFLEGFRVLPYGEPRNDWLEIDRDYVRRLTGDLPWLEHLPVAEPVPKEALIFLPNSMYVGAVFVTSDDAPDLHLLINREGFVPCPAYDHLMRLTRVGIDLLTRTRARFSVERLKERREQRKKSTPEAVRHEMREKLALREQVEQSVKRAENFALQAELHAKSGDFETAVGMIRKASGEFSSASETSERLISEGTILRILASVGLQMSAFVHEMNALLGTANSVEKALQMTGVDHLSPADAAARVAQLHGIVGDLRRSIQRLASYLVDVVSPDARRRRSRQYLAEQFDSGKRLVEPAAIRRRTQIVNEIPKDLKTPPMFPSELVVVFSNLLTNAIKAAGQDGTIRATAREESGEVYCVVENTGIAVDPNEGERWFHPFESTTAAVDPVLGQGMGMGLPITRNMLSEYGFSIRFVAPSPGYATAVEVVFTE